VHGDPAAQEVSSRVDITQAVPPFSAADPQHRIARQPDATPGWASCQLAFGWSLGTADHVPRRRGAGVCSALLTAGRARHFGGAWWAYADQAASSL